MNLVKVQDLIGPALDWAVAKCENFYAGGSAIIRVIDNRVTKIIPGDYETSECYTSYSPSTNWSQGGPIIDRLEGFQLKVWLESNPSSKCEAHIHNYDGDWIAFGPTPLIAAMRCYVAFKIGYEIQTPKELMMYGHS